MVASGEVKILGHALASGFCGVEISVMGLHEEMEEYVIKQAGVCET